MFPVLLTAASEEVPVTPNVPPTVALLVTARPVPAEVKEAAPEKVLAPAAV